jgi:hypothetical protein
VFSHVHAIFTFCKFRVQEALVINDWPSRFVDFVHKMIPLGVWAAIPEYTWITDISLSNAVAADVLIAIVMCITLRGHHSPFAQTRNVLNALIIYVAGTGIITTWVLSNTATGGVSLTAYLPGPSL